MLGLPYPGGPHAARLAEQGDPDRFEFPRPMVKRGGLDFRFSGLKTHTLTTVRAHMVDGEVSDRDKADIARAFEGAVVDTLVIKCRRALKQENLTRLVMAGGVTPNSATAVNANLCVFPCASSMSNIPSSDLSG